MPIPRHARRLLPLLVVALGLAACGVTSEHPLSDAETSVADLALIGVWEPMPDEGEDPDRDPGRLWIGQRAGEPDTLEMVWLELDEEDGAQRVEVRRATLYTTRLGEHQVASLAIGEEGWVLVRYDHLDPTHLRAALLDQDAVAEAIGAGTVPGRVDRANGDVVRAHLEAEPERLRAWLREQGDAVWDLEDTGRLRRLRLADPGEGSTGR